MAQSYARAPFATSPQNLTYAGPMSYNASMHGSTPSFSSTPFPNLLEPSNLPPEPTYHDISVATHKQIATLQAKLDQKLGPEYISQRPGPGGASKLTYAEGWKIINLANEIFGFNGWSSSICNLTVDYLDQHDEGRKWNCGVSAVVRVTLRDGVYHEDVGYGVAENVRSKGAALDKCKKEAVTDAIKRTLRNFGNLLGNCLYDKQYTQEIVKIKVQPPKFDRSKLYRRPEFEEGPKPEPDTSTTSGGERGSAAAANARNMPPPQDAVQSKHEPAAPVLHSRVQLQPQPQPTSRLPPVQPNRTTARPPVSIPINSAQVTTEVDEAYFNSEDDALYMTLDMEVAPEEDRPLFPEDESDMSMSVSAADRGPTGAPKERNEDEHSIVQHVEAVPNCQTNPQHQHRRRHQQHQHQHQHQQRQQRQQHQQRQHPQHQQHRSPNASQAQTHQSRPPQTRSPDQAHSRQPQRYPRSNQSLKQAHPQMSKSSRSPTVGRLHFTTGVGPSHSNAHGAAGTKRSADYMNSEPMPNRSSDQVSKQREPFAPLAVDEGGDVKRPRR